MLLINNIFFFQNKKINQKGNTDFNCALNIITLHIFLYLKYLMVNFSKRRLVTKVSKGRI